MMKHTWKWMMMLSALMACLLPAVGVAETDTEELKPMSEDEYTFTVPGGLVCTYDTSTDGEFVISIDVNKTQWDDVIVSGGLYIPFWIEHPAGAAYFASSTGNAIPNDQVVLNEWEEYEALVRSENGPSMDEHWMFQKIRENSTSTRFSGRIANYVEEFSCIALTDSYDEEYCYIRWYDANGNTLQSRKLTYRRPLKSADLGTRLIDQLNIFPKERVKGDLRGNCKWAYKEDAVVFKAGQGGDTLIGIEAPEEAVYWATSYAPDMDSDYFYDSDGNEYMGTGKRYAASGQGLRTDGLPSRSSLSIIFKDADKVVIERGIIYIEQELDASLGISSDYHTKFDFDWEQVPDKNLIIHNGAEDAGYKMSYHKGLLTTKLTGNGHDIVDADATVSLELVAPVVNGVQAQSCRINTSGSTSFYGPKDYGFYEERQDGPKDKMVRRVINGSVTLGEEDAFLKYHIPQNNLNIYLPPNYTEGENYVDINMILWYADPNPAQDAEPLCVQYFNRRDEQFRITHIAPVLSSDKDIIKGQKHPIAVDRKGRHWNLYVRYYLQSGDNTRYYEIKCQDENGNWINPPRGEELEIYLPYPEDFDETSDVSYVLNHYSNEVYTGGGGAIIPLEPNMPLERTEYGLMFKATSFSPYVLSWEAPDAVKASSLPQTGDSAPVAIWTSLCVLALCGMAMIRKKKAA